MRFFKFEFNLTPEQFAEIAMEDTDFRGRKKFVANHLLEDTIDKFNKIKKDAGYAFPIAMDVNKLAVGMIVTGNDDEYSLLHDMFDKLDIHSCLSSHNEITIREFMNALKTACNNNFVENDDDVLERFEIDGLCGRFNKMQFLNDEEIINVAAKESLLNSAKSLYGGKDFLDECNRIFSVEPSTKFIGHPVHYIIQNNSAETRRIYVYMLLQALYCQKRILSRRFAIINLSDSMLEKNYVEKLYKTNFGGCVIFNATRGTEDLGAYASVSRARVSHVCYLMKKYRNDVLTIMLLPLDDGSTVNLFYEYIDGMKMINIHENFGNSFVAGLHLQQMAINKGVTPDDNLLSVLDPDIPYYAFELREIFENWLSQKLCENIYPAYSNVELIENALTKECYESCAMDELNSMIGLSDVKEKISSILDYHKAQKIYAARGLQNKKPAMHMSFTGNPGTAKTTVARLFARIMKENYILDTGKFVEVGRKDLVGRFVGWTAKIVEQKFKEAAGGVLFIDEAYSLVDDKNGLFGDEAINTIVQEMENHRDDVIVIFAGYPDRMETFIQRNEGLRSRIVHHVAFDDYSAEELCQIAEYVAGEENFKILPTARKKLYKIFEAARRNNRDFGNGRFARNIIENAKMLHARAICKLNSKDITNKKLLNLTADDIESPDSNAADIKSQIGFALS